MEWWLNGGVWMMMMTTTIISFVKAEDTLFYNWRVTYGKIALDTLPRRVHFLPKRLLASRVFD